MVEAIGRVLGNLYDVTLEVSRSSDLYITREGTLFCVLSRRGCTVRLPQERVNELVQQKAGRRQRPAPDHFLREWIALSGDPVGWQELADEAYAYVGRRMEETSHFFQMLWSEPRWIH